MSAEFVYILSLAVFGAIYARLCFAVPSMVIILPVAYSMSTKIASVFYLDWSVSYVSETEITSQYIGASARHVMYNVVILGSFLLGLAVLRRAFPFHRLKASPNFVHRLTTSVWKQPAVILVLVAIFFQLTLILLSPPWPLPGSGISRHEYWGSRFRYSQLFGAFGLLIAFAPVVAGILVGHGRAFRIKKLVRAGFLLFTLHLIYTVFCGQRFNGLLYVSLLFLGPVLLISLTVSKTVSMMRYVGMGALALSIMVIVSFFDFDDRGISQNEGGAVAGMVYRVLVLQGGVYYTADSDEASGVTARTPDLLTRGMEATIEHYTPRTISAAYSDNSVNLAGSLPGNAIASYGFWWAIVPLSIYGLLLAVVVGLFVASVLRARLISAVFGAYLLVWIFSVYARGTFEAVVAPQFWLFMGAAIIGLRVRMPSSRSVSRMRAVN